jgi:1-acyl-sn-glycerol-3-phosphate acyltransferase
LGYASALKRLLIIVAYTIAFWIALPMALFGLGFKLDDLWRVTRAPWLPGVVVGMAGFALVGWAMFGLWRFGHSVPVSALPPPHLVTSGAYGWMRHPIYLGFQLALIGSALLAGSPGSLVLTGPVLLLGWLLYARREERALVRRFGSEYVLYQTEVGIFPQPPLYRIGQALIRLGALPVHVHDGVELPAGPVVLVSNHACYLDPSYLTRVTRRHIRFLTTAEVFRDPLSAAFFRCCGAIPLRRYRADLAAARRLVWLLEHDAVVGVFVEGERSPLGTYQGALSHVARTLARLEVPIIPVGISGSYDAGPRWAGVLRRTPVTLRIGRPVTFGAAPPEEAIDAAIANLIEEPEPRVRLAGLPTERVRRVLWACPRCRDEDGWLPAQLCCAQCGARWTPTADGRLIGDRGDATTLGRLALPLFAAPAPGGVMVCDAAGFYEPAGLAQIRALEPLGYGALRVSPDGVEFRNVCLARDSIRSVTTERADTLQVATAAGMWQFRPTHESVFRLHCCLGSLHRRQVDFPLTPNDLNRNAFVGG